MPIVELPNGTEIEFPEGTSQDVIKKAIYKKFPEYIPKNQQQNPQEMGVWEMLKNSLGTKTPDEAFEFTDTYLGKPLRAFTGGAVQGLEHALASAANLPLQLSGVKARVPFVDFSDKLADSLGTTLAFNAGDILGNVSPMIKWASVINSVIGKQNLLKDALAGALSGATLGAQSENDIAGRLLGGILGGAIPGLGGLSKPVIAKRISGKEMALNKELEEAYNQVFNSLNDRGLGQVETGLPIELGKVLKSSPKALKDSLKNYLENPTLEKAHRTQSDLGKVIRQREAEFQKRRFANRPVLSSEEKNLQSLEGLRNNIKELLQDKLQQDAPDIADLYTSTQQRYASDYVPYKQGAIKRYQEGDIGSNQLLNELMEIARKSGDKKYYNEIKGFRTRQKYDPLLSNLWKYGIPAGVGAGSLPLLIEALHERS